MKIKKGDKVIVLAGADKGKEGTVLRALPKKNKVIVEGISVRKRHRKPTRSGEKGKLVEMPMPMNVSNVALAGGTKKPKAKAAPKKVSAAKAPKKA